MLIGDSVSGVVVRVIGSVGVVGGSAELDENVCVDCDDESVGVVANERPVDIGEGRIAGGRWW